MPICDDFGYIAERLRQSEQEKAGGPGVQNPAPVDAVASSQAVSQDFDNWFDAMIWSTCC